MTPTILILPGLYNSAPDHWQTLWETMLPNVARVRQKNWETPDRSDWAAVLDAKITAASDPIVLVAHSLGCALTAWWALEYGSTAHAAKIAGALLVAPPDVERSDFPKSVTGFSPMPRIGLPFKSIVVASSNDPWCALPRARSWAADWGATFHDIGPLGHINGDSNLDDWPQGRKWLGDLTAGPLSGVGIAVE
jgi:predicted alpha/beta hydrolase family esterase